MYQPAEVTFIDPRTFDGNPYEVATLALSQCEGILRIYEQALNAAFLMARNAHMERNMAERRPPDGNAYLGSPQGRQFTKISSELDKMQRTLSILKTAASYDPKHPPKA